MKTEEKDDSSGACNAFTSCIPSWFLFSLFCANQDLASAWDRHVDRIVEEAAASFPLSDDEDPVAAAPEELQRALSDPKHRPVSYYLYLARRALHTHWHALRW